MLLSLYSGSFRVTVQYWGVWSAIASNLGWRCHKIIFLVGTGVYYFCFLFEFLLEQLFHYWVGSPLILNLPLFHFLLEIILRLPHSL